MNMEEVHPIPSRSFVCHEGKVEKIEEVGDGLLNIDGLSSLLIVYVLVHSGDVNSSCGPFFRIESIPSRFKW